MRSRWTAVFVALLLAGCGTAMRVDPEPAAETTPPAAAVPETPAEVAVVAPGEAAAQRAASLTGTPYRWGGTSPKQGFDCSGLVQFSYREAAGIFLPRNTQSLRTASQRITRDELRAGDLIFFRLRGPYGHVGIYQGDGTFI